MAVHIVMMCGQSSGLHAHAHSRLQGVAYAKEYAVANGPIILEMDTYRYHGHSMSDPGSTYRTRDEISSMRQMRDPIERIRALLLQNQLLDAAELKKIEKVRRLQAVHPF